MGRGEVINHLKRARGARLLDDKRYFRLLNRTNVTHAMVAALLRKLASARA